MSSVAKSRSFDEHAGVGQGVQQRALAGVGVADDADLEEVLAALDLAELAQVDSIQLAFELVDALADEPAVDLQLLFAGPADADSADRPGGVDRRRPRSPYPGATTSCASRGYVYSNWASSTWSLACLVCARVAKMSRINSLRSSTLVCVTVLQLPDLGGRQVVVEDDDIGLEPLDSLRKLLGLALADISRRIDSADLLLESIDDDRPGTLGQRGQFRQVVMAVRARQNRRDEDGTFFSDS